METVLVTGGAGFIGSHVCERLLRDGHQVVCVDDFNDYYDPAAKERNVSLFAGNKAFSLHREDIRDRKAMDAVMRKHACTRIIHLAARAGVRPSLDDPALYADVNINGTLNLLELAKAYKVKGVVSASSSSVYGLTKRIPFSEDDEVSCQISPYGVSKRAGELYCHAYHELYGIPITCLRFFTVYGPRGRPDMAPYKFTKLIDGGKPIEMFGDGSSRRDYTYIADIVDGIIAAMVKNCPFEIINLGNSNPISLKEFIAIIEEKLGKKAAVKRLPLQPGDLPETYADVRKAERLLGFRPNVSVKEGMGKFIDWYVKVGRGATSQ